MHLNVTRQQKATVLVIGKVVKEQHYRKGNLSPDRIKRLEDIGFIWDILEEQFEKGFQETLRYKESTGNPNAPIDYKTAEGYRLGTWQRSQRRNLQKGKLSPDRIKRLEEIGFIWDNSKNSLKKVFRKH